VETRLSHAELLRRVSDALVANGFAGPVAAPIARTIAACERDGTLSHGLLRLPGYVEAVRSGWADGHALPATLSTSASMIVRDARNGFTHLALAQSRGELAERARSTGSAILLIRNAHHFAALWPDIEDFATDGFIALSCVTSRARVTGWGGGKPVFGTNASAFACPRADDSPIVWDQSASVMSQGEILLAAREGRRLPAGVGVDAQGNPTDDPAAVLEGGALLPFGGVKGASIAFAVEILAAALTGSPFGFESPDGGALPSKGGQFVMVIDPCRAGADVASRAGGLVQAIHAAGSPHLPGSRRYARRRATLTEGIALGARSMEILQQLLESRKDPT
jgi:delta1-piperideine-2-carboxylate reductase